MAASRLSAKMSTASGLAENLPTRLLVKGMKVMVNRNAKFHQARPSLSGDPAEDPVVNEPELGDDVKGNHVADQRVSAFAKLGGEFGG
jgi:hypothetical protein